MANAGTLKDKARSLEQRGAWKEALDVYRRLLEGEGEPDTALLNRIGDLHLRLKEVEPAVAAYERAVGAYLEAGLHHNAAALCKKILRIAPQRASAHRTLGRLSALDGFLPDARQHYLHYLREAERAGDDAGVLAALEEWAELVPGEAEARERLAERLLAAGKKGEAVRQLQSLLAQGGLEGEVAERVRARIREIDPEAEDRITTSPSAASDEPGAEDGEWGELALLPLEPGADPEDLPEPSPGMEEDEEDEVPLIPTLEGLESFAQEEDVTPEEHTEDDEPEGWEDTEEEVESLPLLDLQADFGSAEEPSPPVPDPAFDPDPGFALEEIAEEDEEADYPETEEPLPLLSPDSLPEDAGRPQAREEGSREEDHAAYAHSGRYADALNALRRLLEDHPDDTGLLQKQVEYASRAGEPEWLVRAYLDLAVHLDAVGERSKAATVYRQILELDPTNAEARQWIGRTEPFPPARDPSPPEEKAGEYVDLAALILEDPAGSGETRFRVHAEEPTEEDDETFAEVLSQFRQKVAEHIEEEDAASHYDLGLAFKEMGLYGEAISELQVALRGGANAAPVLEVMGECFMEMGEFSVANRVLERALGAGAAEGELIGVYYLLGRCAERLGEPRRAAGFYERVVALDISFRDAARRLGSLGGENG